MKSKDYASLAGSLATVAIAALAGPLPAAATAGVKELVGYLRTFYEKGALTRDLQREVERVVLDRVADSREFRDPESGRRGLAEAAWTIARHGVSDDRSADLGWDPARAAAQVIASAKQNSRYWGTEEHYALAELAIEATYRGLYRQVWAQDTVLIPAIRAVRGDIDRNAARLAGQLQDLGTHLDERFDTVERHLALLDELIGLLEGLSAQIAELSDQVADMASRMPRRLEGAYGATLEQMLRAMQDRLPDGLLDRDADLAEITAFATGKAGYRWLVGGAFTGKTALMLHAVTGALPDSVDVVSYFLRQVVSDADHGGFLIAVVPQLAELCGVAVDGPDEHTFRRLWQVAAERAHDRGRHLLLVVDGLDEDLRPPGRPSVAALLPEYVAGRAPAAGSAHVHVTSRPNPNLPPDVTAHPGHPLTAIARHRTMDELGGFPGWEQERDLGWAEVDELVRGGGLSADLVGLMAAAAGPLAVSDLAALHTAPDLPRRQDLNDVRHILDAARSFDRVGAGGRPRYQFAHATLLEHARRHANLAEPQHPDRLDPEFRARIDAWADRWQQAGWPPPDDRAVGTPRYLLDTYPATLDGDPCRRAALTGDIGWIDLAIRAAGVDPALATLRAAAADVGDRQVTGWLAVVSAQARHLRPPHPVGQAGHALRHLSLQALQYGRHDLAEAARHRLQALPDPGPVPEWTTLRTSQPALELGRQDASVTSLAVLPDGLVVSGADDGRVRVWDREHPGDPIEVGTHGGPVRAVAALPEGRVVSGADDGRVRVWDREHPGDPIEVGSHDGPVRAVASLPDGRVVSGADDGRVRVWDREHPGDPIEVGSHDGPVRAVASLPDGRVVSGGHDRRVRLWDPDHPGSPVDLGRHGYWVTSVAVLEDGRVVSGGGDRRVRLWTPERPGVKVDLGRHGHWATSVAVLPDGRVVSGESSRGVRMWDPEHVGDPVDLGAHDGPVRAVAVLPDGRVVSGSDDGRVRVWNPSAPGAPVEPGTHDEIRAVAVLPDGRLVSGSHDGQVRLWDPEHVGIPVDLGAHDGAVRAVAVLPDGCVVTGSDDGWVRLWNPGRLGVPVDLGRHRSEVSALAVLPDGRVVSGGHDRRVRLWDPGFPGVPVDLGRHLGGVSALAVLPDGRVVSGGHDRRVRLWNPEHVGESVGLGTHDGPVQAVAVLPDGLVVSSGGDQRVRIWDPADPGEVVAEIAVRALTLAVGSSGAPTPRLAVGHPSGLSWWSVPARGGALHQ